MFTFNQHNGLFDNEKNDIDVGKPTEGELVKNVVENKVELWLAEFRSTGVINKVWI